MWWNCVHFQITNGHLGSAAICRWWLCHGHCACRATQQGFGHHMLAFMKHHLPITEKSSSFPTGFYFSLCYCPFQWILSSLYIFHFSNLYNIYKWILKTAFSSLCFLKKKWRRLEASPNLISAICPHQPSLATHMQGQTGAMVKRIGTGRLLHSHISRLPQWMQIIS